MSAMAKKLINGSMMGICNFIASALIGIIMMPIVVHSLGDRMYGLWVIVGSFLGFYGLFNFGLVAAIQRFISKAIGREDWIEANKVINTSLILFSALGALALILTIGIMIVAGRFVKNPAEIVLFRKIILILGFNTALSFPMRVFSGVLISHIRSDIYTFIEFLKLLMRTVLVVIFLKMGHGILTLAIITSSIEIAGYTTRFILVKRMYKKMVLSKKFINLRSIKSLFKYSSISFVIDVTAQLNSKISNFVITGYLGLSYVTIFAIASNLIGYFGRFIASSVGLMMPVFSQYEGKGDYESIREKYILVTKISGYLSMLIGGSLMLFGKYFIERWMGPDYLEAYPILVVMLLGVTLSLIQKPSDGLLYGISKHKFLAMIKIVAAIIRIMLSIIVVKKYGLMGIAIVSAIIGVIMDGVIRPIYICKAIKLNVYSFYFKVLLPVIFIPTLMFIIFWQFFKGFFMADFIRLAMLASFECIVFVIAIYFIGITGSERAYFKRLAINYFIKTA